MTPKQRQIAKMKKEKAKREADSQREAEAAQARAVKNLKREMVEAKADAEKVTEEEKEEKNKTHTASCTVQFEDTKAQAGIGEDRAEGIIKTETSRSLSLITEPSNDNNEMKESLEEETQKSPEATRATAERTTRRPVIKSKKSDGKRGAGQTEDQKDDKGAIIGENALYKC